MKVTNEVIQNATKELVVTQDLNDISVISLCEKLKIKRQTFYYHYQNIYDVIESVFVDDSRQFLNKNIDLKLFQNNVTKYINDNYDFLVAIANSNIMELVKDFFYDIFYFYFVNKKRKEGSAMDAVYDAGGAATLLLQELKKKEKNNAITYIFSKRLG